MDTRLTVRLALALLLTAATTAVAAAQSASSLWQGTLTLTATRRPDEARASGAVTTTWTMQVRWREGRRVAVTTRRGRRVGQFIMLQDAGSRWTAVQDGRIIEQNAEMSRTLTYSGTGRGALSLVTGWIYDSLTRDDPLASAVPDGAYAIMADVGSVEVRVEWASTTAAGMRTGASTVQTGQRYSFSIGRLPFRPPRKAAVLADVVLAAKDGESEWTCDSQMRLVAARRMIGSAECVQDGMQLSIEWNVGKGRAVVQAVKEAPAPDPCAPQRRSVDDVHARLEDAEARIDRGQWDPDAAEAALKQIQKELQAAEASLRACTKK